MAEEIGVDFVQGGLFEHDDQTRLLGGKGAGLTRMVSLGLPVPPGFILTTDACQTFLEGGWTSDMETALVECLRNLENATEKGLGDQQKPLLVSIRSGAPVSMPGMMDTVLNAGMTTEIARGLGKATGDPRFGWDTLRRFVQSYVSVVQDAPTELIRTVSENHLGKDDGASLSPEALGRATIELTKDMASRGYTVPTDPLAQVREAVGAVFASWTCDRAQTYRKLEAIPDDLFTAATVQMMAFGNLVDRSGTGVAFTRDPSNGAAGLVGDFLQGAQGEDVVAGTHQTLPISALGQLWPDIAAELEKTASLLEHDLRHIADIEFTVEAGKLWVLQYREGKHSPRAALRMAIDMAVEADFPLTREEALERVEKILLDPPMLPAAAQNSGDAQVLATGLAASPGQAVGALCTSVDEAVAAEGRGEAVILVRRETSPSDIAGMAASTGILTTLGGLVSHAAVVARGWGLPAIVGAGEITVLENGIKIGGKFIPSGTEITLDGETGDVLLGAHNRAEIEAPEVAILRGWSRETPSTSVPNQIAGYAEDVTLETVSRALALKGMGDPTTIATVLGAAEAEVAAVFEQLVERKEVLAMPNDRVRPTPDLVARIDGMYVTAAAQIQDQINAEMGAFHTVNDAFKDIVTQWQMRIVDGQQTINDHSDPEYDASVMKRIGTEIHGTIVPIIEKVAKAEARLIRYRDRLASAVESIGNGDTEMVAHPLKDSYHTVWFELHEELIRLSGRTRTE